MDMLNGIHLEGWLYLFHLEQLIVVLSEWKGLGIGHGFGTKNEKVNKY